MYFGTFSHSFTSLCCYARVILLIAIIFLDLTSTINDEIHDNNMNETYMEFNFGVYLRTIVCMSLVVFLTVKNDRLPTT